MENFLLRVHAWNLKDGVYPTAFGEWGPVRKIGIKKYEFLHELIDIEAEWRIYIYIYIYTLINYATLGSDNDLSPGWRQAIIRSKAGILLIGLLLRNKLQWNFNQNQHFFIHENALENIVCDMAAIFFCLPYVNANPEIQTRVWNLLYLIVSVALPSLAWEALAGAPAEEGPALRPPPPSIACCSNWNTIRLINSLSPEIFENNFR